MGRILYRFPELARYEFSKEQLFPERLILHGSLAVCAVTLLSQCQWPLGYYQGVSALWLSCTPSYTGTKEEAGVQVAHATLSFISGIFLLNNHFFRLQIIPPGYSRINCQFSLQFDFCPAHFLISSHRKNKSMCYYSSCPLKLIHRHCSKCLPFILSPAFLQAQSMKGLLSWEEVINIQHCKVASRCC